MRRHLDMLHFAVLLFCLLLIGYGTRLAVMNWHVATPMSKFPAAGVYLSVPFGGLLMLVRTVQIIGRSDQAGRHCPENSPGEESE